MDKNSLSLNNISRDQAFDFLHTLAMNDTIVHSPSDNNVPDDSPYNNIKLQCSYLNEYQFIEKYKNLNELSFMSFNIQSLPSKFSELQILIQLLQFHRCAPDVILLQEIWNIIDPSFFHIEGYHPIIYKSRTLSQGGGVGIYIKSDYRFNILHSKSIFIDRVFESLTVEVFFSNNKKKHIFLCL